MVTHEKARKCHSMCLYRHCPTYSKTRVEQQLHIHQVHEQGDDKIKCVYCDMWFLKISSVLRYHVGHTHKKVAIKCIKVHCRTYFKNENERQEHMEKVHLAEKRKRRKLVFTVKESIPPHH